MNMKSKLRLALDVVLVAVVASGLAMFVEAKQAAIDSEQADISAAVIGVGTDYTGLVTEQLVQEGQEVTAGQVLSHIKSSTLIEQMRDSGLKPEELLYPLNDKGEILLKAPKAGTVSAILYGQGAFVPANKEVIQIIDKSSVRVTATYQLARRDFARVSKQTRIRIHLPNGKYINGHAEAITVISQKETVETEIQAKLAGFEMRQLQLASGTPVDTRLYIKENTAWRTLKDTFNSVF